jgi:hypothetical protein
MSVPAIMGDLSVYSIDAVPQLAFVREASISIEHETADGAPVTRIYESDQIVGSSARMRASLMSVLTGSTKVNNLDVSAFSVGGTDLAANLLSGSLNVEWQHVEAKAVGTRWAYPVCVGKTISMDAEMKVPAVAGAGLALLMDGTTADLEVAASVTINGVPVTFAGLLKSLEHTIPQRDMQRHRVQITGRSPDTGAFPAAPAGNSSLLEKFLNTLAAQAFVFTTKASGGATYTGNMLPLSYRLSWANNQILLAECEWAVQGTLGIAATA